MLKKSFTLFPLFLIVLLLISFWKFPAATPILGILLLLAGLAISIFGIFEKHKESENPRVKIAKDVSILVITLLLIIFFGGLAALFTNYYIAMRFGTIVGFVAAIVTSFIVGYVVKKSFGRMKG